MPKKSKKVSKPRPLNEPVFTYTSVCHDVRATKEPLVMDGGRRIGAMGAGPETTATGRGHFRCGECRKPCKVKRTRNTSKTEENR